MELSTQDYAIDGLEHFMSHLPLSNEVAARSHLLWNLVIKLIDRLPAWSRLDFFKLKESSAGNIIQKSPRNLMRVSSTAFSKLLGCLVAMAPFLMGMIFMSAALIDLSGCIKPYTLTHDPVTMLLSSSSMVVALSTCTVCPVTCQSPIRPEAGRVCTNQAVPRSWPLRPGCNGSPSGGTRILLLSCTMAIWLSLSGVIVPSCQPGEEICVV